MKQRIVRSSTPCVGGHLVSIEVTEAYTNGASRFEEVFVSAEALRGKTPAEKRQAVFEAQGDPVFDIAGTEASAPAETRELVESRMVALFETWQRWKATRLEAEARTMPAAVVAALASRENAAWAAYVVAITRWRAL